MAISITSLFTLIIILLAIGLFVWLAFYILQNFPPPEPIGRLIRVVIVVVAVLILVAFLLNLVGIGSGVRLAP
jgi:hypothetical protein